MFEHIQVAVPHAAYRNRIVVFDPFMEPKKNNRHSVRHHEDRALSESQRLTIRRALDDGLTPEQISAETHIASGLVWHVISGYRAEKRQGMFGLSDQGAGEFVDDDLL